MAILKGDDCTSIFRHLDYVIPISASPFCLSFLPSFLPACHVRDHLLRSLLKSAKLSHWPPRVTASTFQYQNFNHSRVDALFLGSVMSTPDPPFTLRWFELVSWPFLKRGWRWEGDLHDYMPKRCLYSGFITSLCISGCRWQYAHSSDVILCAIRS